MKQSLQLKLGQQLTMTPQLQQAIRLLQLSTLDLQQEIQQALDSNPMLEISDDHNDASNTEQNTDSTDGTGENQQNEDNHDLADFNSGDKHKQDSASSDNTEREKPGNDETLDSDWSETIPNDLPVDSNWDDVYQSSSPGTSSSSQNNDDSEMDFEGKNCASETLLDHLLWQLNLTPMSERDQLMAIAIIDAIAPSGMLSVTPEDIFSGLEGELEDLEMDEFEAVRHRIQQFDPVGVASKDLSECLFIQLKQLPSETPYLREAKLIVDRHLQLLASRDFAQLLRRTRLKEPQLKIAIELIQSLNPHPGDIIDTSETEYVVPDVFVKKINDRWTVDLNPDIAPKIKINNDYASLIKRADNSSDNTYLRDNLQEARWFLKSLQSRNETLMKVSTCIVEHQRGFLDYGEEAMKPLVLHDIAQAVEMHESTISRVTTKKYMHTPRGIFELKYFFSSHVSTASGGECSSTAIRALIKKLVAAENPKKPLSDSKITTLLDEQGIKVARRTIAKYREALSIPPSNERKRLV
jgi:RNA polymerase sigma-54 factor